MHIYIIIIAVGTAGVAVSALTHLADLNCVLTELRSID